MNPTPHDWKEARRLQAWHLMQQGWSQRRIAAALGVSEGAVSQWMTRACDGGPEALRHRPHPGAARRLSADQLARLPELLHHGAEAYGFRGQVWTRSRIAALIQLAFGIWYHPRHVGRLCQTIRWSPQKPARRCPSRKLEAVNILDFFRYHPHPGLTDCCSFRHTIVTRSLMMLPCHPQISRNTFPPRNSRRFTV